MKVIFLDINGVLDTYDNMDELDEDRLRLLKYIVDNTSADVVISSSLKNTYYYNHKLTGLLKKTIYALRNLNIEVVGLLEMGETRVLEIKSYLNKHPEIKNFCIIDDDYDMDEFKDNMVKLKCQRFKGNGLDLENSNKAINILNRYDKKLTLRKN